MRIASRRFLPAKDVYELKLESGEKLWLRPEDMAALEDDEIPAGRLAALIAASEYLHARDCALGLLARREYFQLELKDRLFRKGFGGRTIGRVMSELAAEDYQSDDRAARSLLGERVSRGGVGPLKLLALLMQKGYDKARGRHLVGELLPADFEREEMRKFVSRRAKGYREQMARELAKLLADEEKREQMGGEAGIRFRLRNKYRAKIYARVRAAGFSSDIATQAAKEIIRPED